MFQISCDNPACGKEIQTGPGQPALNARQRVYCEGCAVYVAQVEAQLRKEGEQFARDGIKRLHERREELMAQMLPTNRGGTGQGFSEWPKVG